MHLDEADPYLDEDAKAEDARRKALEKVRWREDYAWGDEGGKVKVYLEFPEPCLNDAGVRIETKFEPLGFELVVHGLPGGLVGVRNGEQKLANQIVPDKCSHRVSSGKNRITITLSKSDPQEPWSTLMKKVISQHTGWN